jgi:hypothetical protein
METGGFRQVKMGRFLKMSLHNASSHHGSNLHKASIHQGSNLLFAMKEVDGIE